MNASAPSEMMVVGMICGQEDSSEYDEVIQELTAQCSY